MAIAGGVHGDGTKLTAEGLRQAFEPAAQVGSCWTSMVRYNCWARVRRTALLLHCAEGVSSFVHSRSLNAACIGHIERRLVLHPHRARASGLALHEGRIDDSCEAIYTRLPVFRARNVGCPFSELESQVSPPGSRLGFPADLWADAFADGGFAWRCCAIYLAITFAR
jgi:hypothetical protein